MPFRLHIILKCLFDISMFSGCVEGWHGSADILLEEELPVRFVSGDQAETDEDENQSDSSVEINMKREVNENEKSQVIAKTIVFSFFAEKYRKSQTKFSSRNSNFF